MASAGILPPLVTIPSLHDELVELALSGRGWPAILDRLATEAGREVRLIGVHGTVLASAPHEVTSSVDPSVAAGFEGSSDPAPIVCADGWRGSAIPVRAGSRRVGLLAMGAPASADQLDMLVAATVPVSIEAVRRDAEAATQSGERQPPDRRGSLRSAS